MDSIKEEYSYLNKILEENFDFYKEFWTDTFPVQRYTGKNVTLEWLGNENKENINPLYKDTKIIYSIDDNGYRYYPDKVKKTNKKAYCFGCSYTFGHGLPDNETWPYRLGEKLGSDWGIHNFGKCGASVEEVARIFYQVIKNTPPENHPNAIFFLFPTYTRETYLGNIKDKPIYSRVWFNDKKTATYESEVAAFKNAFTADTSSEKYVNFDGIFIRHDDALIRVKAYYYLSSIHCFFKNVMYFNLIKETCQRYNIPWYWYTWSYTYFSLSKDVLARYMSIENTIADDNGLKILDLSKNKFSRDMTHCSGNIAEELASTLYDAYKK